jgi:hypothetical protein
MKPRDRVFSAVVAFGLLALAGCDQAPDVVEITPTDFFSGDLKRLKPHVDFQAVCFKIKKRATTQCSVEVEMWCDGRRVDRPNFGANRDWDADEVTMSWRKRVEKGKAQYHVSVGGLDSYYRVLEVPKSTQKITRGFGPGSIEKTVKLKSPGNSIVWALGVGEGADLAKPEEVQAMLNRAPWVMVLRLSFRDDD